MRNLVSKTKWIVRSDSPGWPLGFKYLITLIHISTCKCVFVRICVHTYTHKLEVQDISSHQPYNVLLRRVPRRWDDTHSCTAIESSATPICNPRFPSKSLCCLSVLQSPVLSVNFLTWLWQFLASFLGIQIPANSYVFHSNYICSISEGFQLIINTAMCLNPGDTFYNP